MNYINKVPLYCLIKLKNKQHIILCDVTNSYVKLYEHFELHCKKQKKKKSNITDVKLYTQFF